MFTLQDIPTAEEINQICERFPDANPRAIETVLRLLRVGSDLMSLSEAHFANLGISTGRFTILMLLNRLMLLNPKFQQGISPSELAERGGVSRATITGLLDNLERDELIVREHDPNDRRSILIKITSKGIEFLHSILPTHFRRVAWITSSLSDEEKTTLIKLIGKITHQLKQIDNIPKTEKNK